MRDGWAETSLDELVVTGAVSLGRGNVISKKDMEADPGPYPVYSSAQNNDGRIGSYNRFMFDEELITWSVDGGGYVFYRPHHKFSVTNIGGYLRILDNTKFLYPFLAAVLQKLHGQHVFDWQNKAHPSVIRKLYNNIPLASLDEQKRIVDVVSSVDAYIDALQQQVDMARTARSAVLYELLSTGGENWVETTLDELVVSGVVSLGRGNVISKKDMEADPGPYPVYSSAQNNDGRIGTYNKYMFDEELITWSVDGGGHVFYRPHHKFSVTNIGGYLRILDGTKFVYPFLAAVLQKLHGQHVFDWQNKAHPSVIRTLYNNIPMAPLVEQKRIVDVVSSMDEVIQSTEQAVAAAKNLRAGLLSDLLSGEHEIPESYDKFVGAA